MVGIKAHGRGLMLSILRYGNEIRDAKPYFETLTVKTDPEAVALAKELIKRMSGRFEPEKMFDEYSRAVRELVKAKLENRAPEVMIEADGKPKAPVINIMDALKKSMQHRDKPRCATQCGSEWARLRLRTKHLDPLHANVRVRGVACIKSRELKGDNDETKSFSAWRNRGSDRLNAANDSGSGSAAGSA